MFPNKMIVLSLLWINPVMADVIDLPSGTQATLHEVLVDQVGDENWLRFRFVAPIIDQALEHAPTYSDLEADFPFICQQYALPYAQQYALTSDKIAISLSDRIVEFGATNSEATQYFDVFRHENADCIWEGF